MADFDHISHKKLPGLPWQAPCQTEPSRLNTP